MPLRRNAPFSNELIADAFELDKRFTWQNFSYADSRQKVIGFLLNESGYNTDNEKIKARLEIALHLKNIVCEKYKINSKVVGIVRRKEENGGSAHIEDFSPIIEKLKEGYPVYSKLGTFMPEEKIPYTYIISISDKSLLERDGYNFIRIISHELGHIYQKCLGNRQFERTDEDKVYRKIRECGSQEDSQIAWAANNNEIEADRFSYRVCGDLIKLAETEVGKEKISMLKSKHLKSKKKSDKYHKAAIEKYLDLTKKVAGEITAK